MHDQELIELLNRWQSGDYTKADEAKLREHLAAGDAFARSAADGYAAFPEEDHAVRLARLRQKIISEKDTNRGGWTWFRSFAVAASIAILLIAGWWALPMRQESAAIAQQLPESTPIVTAPVTPPPSATEPASDLASAPKLDRAIPSGAGANSPVYKPAADKLPAPTVHADKETAQFDDQPQPTIAAAPAPVSASPQSEALLREAKSEEEMMSRASKAKKSADAAPKRDIANGFILEPGGPVPVNGWPQFQQYWMQNSVTKPGAQNQSGTAAAASVLLRFEVDMPSGKPIKIEVQQGTDASINEEAVRLLRNSVWTVPPGANKTGKVWVRFGQ